MIRIRTLSVLSVFICLMGLFAASVGAAAEPNYGVSIDDISASCTSKEVVVTYGFDNFSGGEGTSEIVTMTLETSGGTLIDSTSEVTVVHFEPSEPYRITLFLTTNLKSGITYTVILKLDNGEQASQTFVACAGSSGSTSTSQKTDLPPCKLNDDRLDKSCAAPVTTFVQSRDDGCYINIYSPYGRADGKTVFLLQATAAEIAAAQGKDGNAVIDSMDVVNLGSVTVYWLPVTQEFQINAGPNAEGKVYVLNFTGCPASNIYTTNSYRKTE